MALLMASARSPLEAALAAQGGAAVVDLKEPRRGALGRVDFEIACAAQRELPPRVALGLCLGEWQEWRGRGDLPRLAPGARFLKLGLAGLGAEDARAWRVELRAWRARLEARATLAPARRWVAVLYADWRAAAAPGPEETLELAAESGFGALLIDTWQKDGGADGLFRCLAEARIAAIVDRAQALGLLAALSGSLSLAGARRAAALGAALIGARGALCAGGARDGTLDVERVRAFAAALASPEPAESRRLGSAPLAALVN